MNMESSTSLIELLENEEILPSLMQEANRKYVVRKLNQIAVAWSKKVARLQKLPACCIKAASATVLIEGSTGLGAHGHASDLNVLIVGPWFASMDDFFISLTDMLVKEADVSNLFTMKAGNVHHICLKFDGISTSVLFAKLDVSHVCETLCRQNPFFLRIVDGISWGNFSGVRANHRIMQVVPNLKVYQLLLRGVKFWAIRRGIYANEVGYFGGIHLAVLTAYVCRRNPGASLSTLMSYFFQKFALWAWPEPVRLDDGADTMPLVNYQRRNYIMAVQLPCTLPSTPSQYCFCGYNRSTFSKISEELQLAHGLTKGPLKPSFDWRVLFEPFPYTQRYERFLKILVSSRLPNGLGAWAYRVKSQLCHLVLMVEKLVEICDPNPTVFADDSLEDPHRIFYWGLSESIGTYVNPIEKDFMNMVLGGGYTGPTGALHIMEV